jgi:hypothetical protein
MWWVAIGITGALLLLLVYALCRTSAAADADARRAHVEHFGSRPCVKCGRSTFYNLHGVPMHPECRDDLERTDG